MNTEQKQKHKKRMNRKAQITVFIIVGLFLVMSSAMFFYIRNETVNVKVPDVVMEKVPAEFQPISDYVTSCIKSTAEAALVKVGEGGGYVNFQAKNSFNPTNGDANGVKFPGTNFPGAADIPYWYYLKGENKGKSFAAASEQPYLTKDERAGRPGTSIEEQVELFFNEQFPLCIDEFSAFKGQGFFISQEDDPKVGVTIAEEDVVFKVYYPLILKRGGSGAEESAAHEIKTSKYVVTVPLKLKKIYLLAKDIAEAQNYFTFLEKDAIAMLSTYSGLKDGDLPPFSDMDIGSSTRTWSKADAARKFHTVIQLNSQALQIQGSRNFRPNLFMGDDRLLNSLRSGIYGNKILPNQALLDSADFVRNFEVSFNVPNAREYFDLPACSGTVCKPSTINAGPFGLQIHSYNFVYDASYPVVVEIYYPEFQSPVNPGQNGFAFRFATEVNIRGNEPLTAEFQLLDAKIPEATMFCDENKRTSGEIEFDIKDSVTRDNLKGVLIQVATPDQTCNVNTTDTNKTSFRTKLPSGFCGGTIIFSKEGYLGKEISNVCINAGQPGKHEVLMKQLVDVQASVKYKLVSNEGPRKWKFDPLTNYKMRNNDRVVLTLTRIPDPGDSPYSVPLVIEATKLGVEPWENLTLAEGRYTIDAQVYSGQKFTIPPNARTYSCGKRCTRTEYIPDKPQVVASAPVGGLVIDQFKPWKVSGAFLGGSKYVTFKVIYVDYVGAIQSNLRIEDLQQIDALQTYITDYRGQLEPQLSSMPVAGITPPQPGSIESSGLQI